MKAFLVLIAGTLWLGTSLSLHLRPESLVYAPLYLLAIYQIHRLNLSEGFFLVFHETKPKDEVGKIRLGPAEIHLKDDADKNEDKFLDFFDWKKTAFRKALSWGVFCSTIYLLVFRLHLEISLETVMPAITALFLMRVVAIGHFLVPLAISLLMVLRSLPESRPAELAVAGIYGALLVIDLALIYPSEERLGRKLRDWISGKGKEISLAVMILLGSFVAGLSLFPTTNQHAGPLGVSQEEIQDSERKLTHLQSSLRSLKDTGLLRKDSLSIDAVRLKQQLADLQSKEDRSLEAWKEFVSARERLEKNFQEELIVSATPSLSPELLESMKKDLRSRSETGVGPETFGKMQQLLQRLETFEGSVGSELVTEFRELKYGKNGYYREETELGHGDPEPREVETLEKMAKAPGEKKEVTELLEENIQRLRESPDEGLQAVNRALKDELESIDRMSPEERALAEAALEKTRALQEALAPKTSDPELARKISQLLEENQQLKERMTPHMDAEAKSMLAMETLDQWKTTKVLEEAVRNDVATRIRKAEDSLRNEKNTAPKEDDRSGEKLQQMITLLSGGVILIYFLRRLRKKGVKKVRGVPEEVREELRQKLRDVKGKNLSPREEVIQSYNVFHDALKDLVFTQETPPSCIVYEGLRSAEPELEAPTYTVTETFAQTFYGDRDVSAGDLQAYRKDLKKIFEYFDITVS